jgi:hypothetical protein
MALSPEQRRKVVAAVLADGWFDPRWKWVLDTVELVDRERFDDVDESAPYALLGLMVLDAERRSGEDEARFVERVMREWHDPPLEPEYERDYAEFARRVLTLARTNPDVAPPPPRIRDRVPPWVGTVGGLALLVAVLTCGVLGVVWHSPFGAIYGFGLAAIFGWFLWRIRAS